MAGLAADQDPAHGSGRADAQIRMAALDLGGRRVSEIRQVALARMDDEQPAPARRREHRPARLDHGREPRHVVAERLAESAGLEEVALHVNDHQRQAHGVEGVIVGLSGDGHLGWMKDEG